LGHGKAYQRDELELLENCARTQILGKKNSKEPDTASQARVSSVKANPKDERLALACLRACLEDNEFGLAMEIVPVLEKNFPETRKYSFWWIVMSYLYATVPTNCSTGKIPSAEDVQKQMFLKLAFAKMKMFASATKKAVGEGVKLPPKSLQSPQELLLLYRISRQSGIQGYFADAFVLDDVVGANSLSAKGEWALQLELLDFLLLTKNWAKLFAFSQKLLLGSRANSPAGQIENARGADWAVWKAYLQSALELFLEYSFTFRT
jgi:N-terminal acetyltransferase B complex non-catalytic subunit